MHVPPDLLDRGKTFRGECAEKIDTCLRDVNDFFELENCSVQLELWLEMQNHPWQYFLAIVPGYGRGLGHIKATAMPNP